MPEEEMQDFEKPKEILEIEKTYGVTLSEQKDSFDFIVLHKNFTYTLNLLNEVVSLKIEAAGIKNIDPIFSLKKLLSLDLSYNEIINIDKIDLLPDLHTLSLTANRIKSINGVQNLTRLEKLELSNNPIREYTFLQKCISIKELTIIGLEVQDYSFLYSLKKLTRLCLASNSISDLSGFDRIQELDVLWLNSNRIKKIPKNFCQKYNWLHNSSDERNWSNSLLLFRNPLEFPPASVIQLGPENVKNYYEDAEQYGHKALSEGRIIFVGDGSAGKSSIIEKVLYNSFTLGREQTNGINIEHLQLQHPEDNRQLTFHLWDFGGQEIQHAVHKFFFTEGCLYIVVLDSRKEEEPEYWLQQIESLGGGAPVLVVFNKHDENAVETTDRKYLKEKYPNIVGFYNTSCKTGFGIEDFKASLEKEVVKLRTVSEQFPNNWLAIKKAIEEYTSGSQHFLTYEAYKEICKQNHLVSEDAQKLLLKYFNTIGSVTWFGDDTYLKFLHVLNPAWITQGVYKILTAKKTANLFGQIEVKDFKELLQPVGKDDYTYDEEHYGYLLAMMDKFKLCYTSDNQHLLIPSAFGKVPKVEYSDFRGENVRTYILQFKDYMPLALIHRFIAQKLPEALDNNYWYTGIVLKDTKSATEAMVHADKEAKRIYLRIKGDSKLAVWEHSRRDLATIASSYAKIPYDELVSLDEKNEATVKYEDLVSHIKAQKPFYFHPRLQKDFNVGYLMGLFETKEDTLEKMKTGEIILQDREKSIKEIPPFVFNILNNNTPTINTQITTQVNINLEIVNDIGSNVKGDADYLLEALGDSNRILSEALAKVIQFANDAKAAKNTGDVKEKGWGRKLKSVLDTLGSAGEQLKNIQDGGETVKSIVNGIKDLAHHFNLNAITSLFS